jgi:hypothetical protein
VGRDGRENTDRCPLWVKKQTFGPFIAMSALPPKADIVHGDGNVRFVPTADIDPLIRPGRRQWKVCRAES